MRELNLDSINDYYNRTDDFYAAMRNRSANPEYLKKLSDSSYWKGKEMSVEMRAKFSKAAKQRKTSNKHAKYMTDAGVMFLSDAAKYYSKSEQTIINRAKSANSKFKNWYRIPKEAAE